MRRRIVAALVGFGMSGVLGAPLPASAQTALTEQEAHAIGVNAYLYFYPLLSMDFTRKQSTNIEAGKEVGKGPMNRFPAFRHIPLPTTNSLCGLTSILFIPRHGLI